ncbi:MAG TPA: outer membrane protein OmpK [Bacteriovoracaceae bacterium]|nr:outer membrane protein OmpK [Bacteriovoracaceae bacterium]
MAFKLILPLMLLLSSLNVFATSVSFLWGNNFREDLGYEKEKLTMTIENFSVWEYGTVFFYYDITEPFSTNNGDSSQFFGGIAPTFSLSKLSGKDLAYGYLRDVSLRVEVENGSGNGQFNFRNYFYGLQYEFVVPGFDFLSLNTVLRDSPLSDGVGVQIGGYWQMSWEYGPWRRFKFTGFFATSPWDGDVDPGEAGFSNRGRFLTTQPQLLWDVGNGLTGKKDKIEAGFEYAYFLNRYQQKDKDEKVVQAMVKFSF